MDAQNQSQRIGEILADAEEQFKSGIARLNECTSLIRETWRENPGIVLTSVAITGFLAGTLLRSGSSRIDRFAKFGLRSDQVSIESLFVFIAGAVAGLTVGPNVVQDLKSGKKGRFPEPVDTTA